MKKIISLALAACLCAVAITGCKKAGASYNINDVLNAIEAAAPIESPKDVALEDFLLDTGINAEDIEEFAGRTTNANEEAGTIYIMKTKSGKASDVKTALEAYRDGNADFLGNYPEFATAQDITSAARVIVKGDYVAYVVGGDRAIVESDGAEKAYEPIDKAIDEAFK